MVRAFEPKKYNIELRRASKKSSQAEPSFWKHVAREPNFELSLGSTQPYIFVLGHFGLNDVIYVGKYLPTKITSIVQNSSTL